jgi:CarD family transcriptional regulator
MPPRQAGAARPTSKPAAPAPIGMKVKPPFGPGARPMGVSGQRPMPAANKQPGHTVTAPAGQNTQKAAVKGPPPPVNKKPVHQRHGFKTSEWIVYPAHGVGRIIGIEEQEIAGVSLELFVITFEKDKMTLRVPTGKSQSVGMRKLAEENTIRRAMETLKGKARVKRTMWSRRAQEYEAKINSGDLISIAEVVRDLYRSESQPEQSYSERQLYEAALDRMAREVAVVDKLDERGAVQRITEVLAKSAKGRRIAAEEAEVKAA